ncbi:MAG: cation:proton antiporter [Desulfuromonadales bacterium]|nr:cation:proton antiporter [Desulfuromonadales bacterium]
MPDLTLLQDILILICLALANAYLFSWLRQSPIVGYLVTGLVVGPYGFHLIGAVHEVEMVAEIGVILLLFTIGLEFSYSRIFRLKTLLLRSGSIQVTTTGLIVFACSWLMGMNLPAAASLGMAMALSSTAIVLKLLLESGEVDSAHGRISLSILLFQDLCVIFFLVSLPLLGPRSHEFSAWTFVRAGLIMVGIYVFARHLLKPFLRGILRTRSPELFRLTILALVLGTAWATALAGLSLALGAFLAGLALAESDSSHQVLADIIPFRDVFLAVFFISIGMLINIRVLTDMWPFVLAGLLLLSLIKVAAGTLAAMAVRYPLRTALTSGLMIFQVGEFSFILLKQALSVGAMPEETYHLALSVVALSMMFTPLIFGHSHAIASRIAGWLRRSDEYETSEDKERTGNLEGHVVIAGYGLSGRNVAHTLRKMHLPYIHVEINGEAVHLARQSGDIIIHGDTTAPAVLEGAGIKKASALVLAINDPSALARVIPTARELNPDIYILARTRFVANIEYLQKLGADEIITDEFGAGLELATFLLRKFHISEGRILKILSTLREEHLQRYQQRDLQTRNLAGYLSVLDGGEIEIQAVPDDSPCLGKSLAELNFRVVTGASVMGVVRHERVIYSPSAELRLEAGDTLMLLGEDQDIHKAREFLHGHSL